MSRLFSLFLISFVLLSCNEEQQLVTDQDALQVEFSITPKSRVNDTLLDNTKKEFKQNDAIGLFSSIEDLHSKWMLTEGTWIPDNYIFWINRDTTYTFQAYYPYVEGASVHKIPMPSLTRQQTDQPDLSDIDFLAGQQNCKYTDCNGTLSFTGIHAMNHVYAMIIVNLTTKNQKDEILLKDVSFSGENLFSHCFYSFGPNQTGNAVTVDKSQKAIHSHTFTYNSPVQLHPGSGYNVQVLVNPLMCKANAGFSIHYTSGMVEKYAFTDALSNEFKPGYYYKYNMVLNDAEIIEVTGLEINGRKVDILPDIIFPSN